MSGKPKGKKMGKRDAPPREDITDPRFTSMYSAPLFKKFRKEDNKLKLDNRFKTVLTEERFRSTPGEVDKYGRKFSKSSKKAAEEELEKFYSIEEEEHDGQENKAHGKKVSAPESRLEYLNKLSRGDISDNDDSSSDDYEEEGYDNSSNSSDDSTAGGAMQQDEEVLTDEENAPTGEASFRLALQNCDWENLSAEDLIVVLQSFCPTGRTVRKVTVYPSDFGKEQMAHEEKYGPTRIWEKLKDTRGIDGYNGVEDDEDIYDGVVVDGEDEESQESQAEEVGKRCNVKGADFRRKGNTVGLVMQDELVRRGKADKSTLEGDDLDGNPRIEKGESGEAVGLNVVALRKYELNKLKYYFGVAEFDSLETADLVYKELDGMELENSSMTFDLRFVPDDMSLEGREVRDSCTSTSIAPNYKPPDFIVQALQRTNVECTWDEGDKDRGRKLGRSFGGWKDLNESELQQYLASDSDEGDEEAEDMRGVVADVKSKKRGIGSKKDVRKLLLGNQSDDDASNASEGDDFFLQADDEDGDKEEGSDVDMEYSFVPGENVGEANSDAPTDETPFEKIKRKLAEKKKAKKASKKELTKTKEAKEGERNGGKITNIQHPHLQTKAKVAASKEELDLMFADDGDDYDMHAVVKAERAKKKKKKPKKEDQDETAAPDDFKIDVTDTRFAALMQGDAKFGIDPLATEYKETQAMRKVIKEVKKRRKKERKSEAGQEEGQNSPSRVDLGALKSRIQNQLREV